MVKRSYFFSSATLAYGLWWVLQFFPIEVIEAELQYQMQPVYSCGAVSILEASL